MPPQVKSSPEMTRPVLHLLLYIAILFGLCVYSATIGPRRVVTIGKVLANPVAFAGKELNLQYAGVTHLLPQALQVEQSQARITVQVPATLEQPWEVWKRQLQAHDYVSLQATFHPEGYLILRDMHVHEGRWLKIWVSVFALFLLAGILLREHWKVSPCHA